MERKCGIFVGSKVLIGNRILRLNFRGKLLRNDDNNNIWLQSMQAHKSDIAQIRIDRTTVAINAFSTHTHSNQQHYVQKWSEYFLFYIECISFSIFCICLISFTIVAVFISFSVIVVVVVAVVFLFLQLCFCFGRTFNSIPHGRRKKN